MDSVASGCRVRMTLVVSRGNLGAGVLHIPKVFSLIEERLKILVSGQKSLYTELTED
jgi:hypothetical protein